MKFALAAIAATLTTGSAIAGGYATPVVEAAPIAAAPVAPVVIEQTSDWTGFYAGLQYGKSSGAKTDDIDFGTYGLHGGYLHDLGKFVVGGELDYNKVKIDINNVKGKGHVTRLRARAGYDLGRFLPYATIGAAYMSTELPGFDISGISATYGIGADFKVSERFTVGAEYTRNNSDNVFGAKDLAGGLMQLRGSFRF